MICIHVVGQSRFGSPWGVINLTKWNRLTWDQHGGQKSRDQCDASVIILECLQRKSWGNSESLSSCQLESSKYTMEMHSRNAGWWKIMPKGKMKMPKSLTQPCQACPLAIWWQNATGPKVRYSLGDTKWETASSPLGKGKLWGCYHILLGFQLSCMSKPLSILKHISISHTSNSTFREKKLVSDILNKRTNFTAVGRD